MTDLFSPLTLRGVTLKNRIGVAPMCQYSCADDGQPTEWHLVHLASRAVGGAALVIVEATAVTPEGRITPEDVGIWTEGHVAAHARIATSIARHGAVAGVQLAHAGRKASRVPPWEGHAPTAKSWTVVGPSAVPFGDYATPHALSEAEIRDTVEAFATGARRAIAAGYRFVEVHAAHGYLLHQFLSPLSNTRNDAYGGDLQGRARFPLEVVRAVRAAIPDDVPLCVRVSHSDWAPGGWDTPECVEFARMLKPLGVDIVDVSSGGNVPEQKIPIGPGYQVPGAAAVREGSGLPVAAVGLITEPQQAQDILSEGKADVILLARGVLRDPYWPLHAAAALGRTDAIDGPPQYERGWNALGKVGMDRAIAEPMDRIAE